MKRNIKLFMIMILLLLPISGCSIKYRYNPHGQDPEALFHFLSEEDLIGDFRQSFKYMYPALNRNECMVVLNNPDKIPEDGNLIIPKKYKTKVVTQLGFFQDAENLISVDMSDTKITIVRHHAFAGCKNLKEVTLSPHLLQFGCPDPEKGSIDDGLPVFYQCTSLESIILPVDENEPNSHFKTVDGVLYFQYSDFTKWSLLFYPAGKAMKGELPLDLTKLEMENIYDWAFDFGLERALPIVIDKETLILPDIFNGYRERYPIRDAVKISYAS